MNKMGVMALRKIKTEGNDSVCEECLRHMEEFLAFEELCHLH